MLWKKILQRFSILYWVSFAIGLSNAALGPALPAFAIQTHSGMTQIGLLFTARAFGFLLGSLVIGRAFDKLPGNRLLAGVLVFLSLLLVVMPFPGLLWLLIIILLGVGIAEGSLDIGANLLIVWQHLHNSNLKLVLNEEQYWSPLR